MSSEHGGAASFYWKLHLTKPGALKTICNKQSLRMYEKNPDACFDGIHCGEEDNPPKIDVKPSVQLPLLEDGQG